MRITAGTKRGATLLALASMETRPTLDHVKEAVFSMIGRNLTDARVLDLYAGSGAIGLECLSRGAAEAVFVDDSLEAIKIIEKNIEKLNFKQCSTVLALKDFVAIEQLKRLGQKFQIIYLDPPFGKTAIERTVKKLLAEGLIAEQGRIIIEESFEERIELSIDGTVLEKDKRYGRISIRVLRRTI